MSLLKKIHEKYSVIASYDYIFPYKASDGKWYVERSYPDGYPGDEGYVRPCKKNATVIGPFDSYTGMDAYMGSANWGDNEDNSGTRPPPEKSPNGEPVQEAPSKYRWMKDKEWKLGLANPFEISKSYIYQQSWIKGGTDFCMVLSLYRNLNCRVGRGVLNVMYFLR